MKLIIELKDETYKFFKEKLPVIIARSGGKTLTSDVYEAIKNGKPYDEADKWISVKERLPEDYGNYLVFTVVIVQTIMICLNLLKARTKYELV